MNKNAIDTSHQQLGVTLTTKWQRARKRAFESAEKSTLHPTYAETPSRLLWRRRIRPNTNEPSFQAQKDRAVRCYCCILTTATFALLLICAQALFVHWIRERLVRRQQHIIHLGQPKPSYPTSKAETPGKREAEPGTRTIRPTKLRGLILIAQRPFRRLAESGTRLRPGSGEPFRESTTQFRGEGTVLENGDSSNGTGPGTEQQDIRAGLGTYHTYHSTQLAAVPSCSEYEATMQSTN